MGNSEDFLRDVNEACRAPSWMHDEETLPPSFGGQ